MKNVPLITTLLWLIILFGYWLLPSLFKQDLLQIPLVLLLSVLLPVSFWQVANTNKKHLSFIFIGMFTINVLVLLFILKSNYSAQQFLSKELSKGVNPELVEYLEKGSNSQKRKLVAKIIYQSHGIAMPYKIDNDKYALYAPSASDKVNLQENLAAMTDLEVQNMGISYSFLTILFLLTVHITLFIILLLLLVLYDKKSS